MIKGFVEKEPEEGEDEDMDKQEEEDPEILEEAEDFDQKLHEIEVVKELLGDAGKLLIDGNFYFAEEDPDEVANGLMELLSESRLLPEIIIVLKVSERNMLKRLFNQKAIKDIYDA